jgi:hypothetical protein
MKKEHVIPLLLLILSLFGFLEWGKNQHSFLFQVEADILSKIFQRPKDFIHPFILLPLIGQCSLIISLFWKRQKQILEVIGILSLSVIMLMILLIGIITLNVKMLLSSLPFVILAIWQLRQRYRNRQHRS